jgi:site-specific DNA-cytosine methylase
MIVLSLFDGMSCGQIAFERAGIRVEKYYASEIDKYAIQITQKNYPNTIQLGSITEWKSWNIEMPDMIIGGSPCQGFSFAGKQLNFEDERSKLFFTFVEILKHYKPKYFLLENVIMKAEYNDVISSILGDIYPECVSQGELFRTGRLEPIEINSALVSAQNRRRLYWTNIPGITQPKDKGILLKDIIENATTEKEKSYCSDANYYKGSSVENYQDKSRRQMVMNDDIITHNLQPRQGKGQGGKGHLQKSDGKSYCLDTGNMQAIEILGGAFRGRNPENTSDRTLGAPTEQRLEINETGKSNALTSVSKDSLCIEIGKADIHGNESIKRVYSVDAKSPTLTAICGEHQEPKISEYKLSWRKLTTIECERLQTVPDNYTDCVSNTRRYHALGNGWTVDVIAHIFSFIK